MQKKTEQPVERIKSKKITSKNFRKYGWVIEPGGFSQSPKENQFKIVVREKKSAGWRIAYLIVRNKSVEKLEKHPFSMESFEPLKGRALLYAASPKTPQKVECFLLDKPIILKKGIWHAVLCLGKEAHIKITENRIVKLVFHNLGCRLIE